jgi:hypothetical protein
MFHFFLGIYLDISTEIHFFFVFFWNYKFYFDLNFDIQIFG